MKVRTNRSVYEVSLNGNGDGFVAEKLEATEGATTNVTVGSRFEGKVLIINMREKTLLLDGIFFIPGVISIES